MLFTKWACIRLEEKTGISTEFDNSCWKIERKPQLVVIDFTPSFSSCWAALINDCSNLASASITTLFELAPNTLLYRTGKGNVFGLPMSPGILGKTVSSIIMPIRGGSSIRFNDIRFDKS